MNIREVNGKYLVMATGENVLSTLHENIWQWKKGIAENVMLSQLYIAHLYICTFGKNDQQGVNKVSTRCQQGVKFVISARGKKCEVILSVFCLSSENNLRICVCTCNLFLEGGTRSKKNDILEKWRGGKTKCGF